MSCFIEITNDLSELTHYDDIKKNYRSIEHHIKNRNRSFVQSKKSRSYF